MGLQIERNVFAPFSTRHVLPAVGFGTCFKASLSLKSAIHYRPLMHPTSAVTDSTRNVHTKVEYPEALTNFWWSPYNYNASDGDNSLYMRATALRQLDIAERGKLNIVSVQIPSPFGASSKTP